MRRTLLPSQWAWSLPAVQHFAGSPPTSGTAESQASHIGVSLDVGLAACGVLRGARREDSCLVAQQWLPPPKWTVAASKLAAHLAGDSSYWRNVDDADLAALLRGRVTPNPEQRNRSSVMKATMYWQQRDVVGTEPWFSM